MLALAGFAPWLALKIVHFTGDHAHQLHAMASTSAGGDVAGRMGQKVVPFAQRATSFVLAGSAGDQPGATASRSILKMPGRPSARVVAHERAEHEDVAVCEVDQLEDAVHHRVAERDERVDGADGDAIEQILKKGLHMKRPERYPPDRRM